MRGPNKGPKQSIEEFYMSSSEKFRDHVLEQFNGKLLEGGFRVTNDQIEDGDLLVRLLDAMLPELPAAKAKKKK